MKKRLFKLTALYICFTLIIGCGAKHDNNNVKKNTDITQEISSVDSTDDSKITQLQSDNTENSITTVKSESTDEPDNSELSILQKKINESDCMIGIAFIGYVESESSPQELNTYLKSSPTALEYPFLCNSSTIAHEGAELYAFIPANKNTSITVYQAAINENGEYEDHKDEIIYNGDKGETVVLRCNISEIYSNVLVCVTEGDKTLEFHPMLSMKDGHLSAEKGCYDFSVYVNSEDFYDPVTQANLSEDTWIPITE